MNKNKMIETVLDYCVSEFDADKQVMLDQVSYSVKDMSVISNCGMDSTYQVFTLNNKYEVVDWKEVLKWERNHSLRWLTKRYASTYQVRAD